ncbi:Crp/Fnr family transcriptional regulator [Pedobacter cryoconitis]|uniref:CRP-like cAMP-binding protein n=1 Tax=Pedobacter cryoconitis TaxID=188932 RepID=A0A327SUF0_9SPHI|nr:Crp/Fnr family transcriptional regulator [Pedobacter cryoconitis]RAJ32956.1 CRP-like cAMP-binding protein [Pedobacter cryoconitis]
MFPDEMYQHLLDNAATHVKLTAADTAMCKKYFEPVQFAKNTIIEEENEVPKYIYYVVSGFVRLFHYNEEGDQLTTHLNCPPGFITSYTHFNKGTRSAENAECITDCELLRITKADLDIICAQSLAFKDYSILVFQMALAYNETRARELASLTAEQRYQKLITNYPAIIHHVPLRYIASFLGMKPESLSRIRKKISNN